MPGGPPAWRTTGVAGSCFMCGCTYYVTSGRILAAQEARVLSRYQGEARQRRKWLVP